MTITRHLEIFGGHFLSRSSMVDEQAVIELDGPPKPRRTGVWGEESFSGKDKGKRKREALCTVEEDERLKVHDDSDDDIPIIPDLEEIMEEELTAQLAVPPSVAINRVTTYKQLDTELHKHAGLFTLDGEVDLKVLAKVLSPEADIEEDDKEWEWNKLFAELSPDIQQVWDRVYSTAKSDDGTDQSLSPESSKSP